MHEPFYSVRMRASRGGIHISGAERIVRYDSLDAVTGVLLARATRHERGRPDSVYISADPVKAGDVVSLPPLPVSERHAGTAASGRELAARELVRAGVTEHAARAALDLITFGASPVGSNMRGAMVMDAATGMRLEPDRTRGIRARAVDYDEGFLPVLGKTLAARGLESTHLREALALATKVADAPGAVAELCISDDPSYTTGYVASPSGGYVRITPMKNPGDPMGGRAFFVDTGDFDMDAYISYMRKTPVLVMGEIVFE